MEVKGTDIGVDRNRMDRGITVMEILLNLEYI